MAHATSRQLEAHPFRFRPGIQTSSVKKGLHQSNQTPAELLVGHRHALCQLQQSAVPQVRALMVEQELLSWEASEDAGPQPLMLCQVLV